KEICAMSLSSLLLSLVLSLSPNGTLRRQARREARRRLAPRRLHVEPLEDRTVLTIFTVLNTLDSGPGSLRQAILDANATANVGGPDRIEFNIDSASQNGDGTFTIAPLSPLPAITDPAVIDGYTQPGTSPNTLA